MAGLPRQTLYARLWRRSTRNLLLGAALSVLPAMVFYSVSFSYTRPQILALLWLMPVPVAVFLLVDIGLTTLYLQPLRRLRLPEECAPEEVAAAYRRVHNLPLFSFLRVFGPHAVSASAAAHACVYWANRHWQLGIPSGDYWIYWLLNLTLVPIAHAIFEYHANGYAARDALREMVARGDVPETVPGILRVGLAIRLGVFFVLLGLSPLLLTWTAGFLRPAGAGMGSSGLAVVAVGSVALNLFLLFLFAREVGEQTGALTGTLAALERGELDVSVDAFSPDEFGRLAEGMNQMIHGLRDRQRVRELFGVYVSPEVSRAVLDGAVSTQGETREVTVLFLDIRGFTAFSSAHRPTEVVTVLNRVFSAMQPAIEAHRATINKFLGDGFLAVFNAPLDCLGHQRRAIETALEIERRMEELNRTIQREYGLALDIGIGIDSGCVVAGNVGAENRLEYTVIGDTVNRAARIEQHNKQTGTRILVSESTWRAAGMDGGRRLPPASLKGVPEPVALYTVGSKA